MFQHHRIEQNDNGYTLILYLDDQLTEFAQSLGEKPLDEDIQQDLKQGVYQYIREKVPNLKANGVKIVLGSMMVATVPLAQDALVTNAQATEGTEQKQITYIVMSGDTLYSIAKKFNINVNDLKAVNNLTTITIKQGQKLVIPSTTYTVKAEDTLNSIANQYNLSVDTIKNTNQLTTNKIIIGSTLLIPSNEAPATLTEAPVQTETMVPKTFMDHEMDNYTVKGGDTLIGIASLFKTPVDAIKEANGLTSDTIIIGQVLTIPPNTPDTAVAQKVKSTPTFYTVKSEDSLYAIAQKFSMNVNELKLMNGLIGDNIYVGQTLILDTTAIPNQM